MGKNSEDWLKSKIVEQGKNSIFFKSDENPFFTIQKMSLSSSASGNICGEGQLYTLTANSLLGINEQIYVENNSFSESRYIKRKDENYTFGNQQVVVPVKDDSFGIGFKEMIPLFDCNKKAIQKTKKDEIKKIIKTMQFIRPFDEKIMKNYNPENETIQANLSLLLEQNIRCRGLNKPFKPFLKEKYLDECVNFVKKHPDTAIKLWNKNYERIQEENNKNKRIRNEKLSFGKKIFNQFKEDIGLTKKTENKFQKQGGSRR